MHLESLTIKNFRSFEATTIPLYNELTVLVGENNSGKSNTIDAIRLLTSPLGGRRELYCEPTDIRFGAAQREFELVGRFSDISAPQQGRLITAATDHTITACEFSLLYQERAGSGPGRPEIRAGNFRGRPEPGSYEMIRHVYLPPLRDARRALASGSPTRIYALLNHFLDGEDPVAIAQSLKRGVQAKILSDVGSAVDLGLTALTAGVRRQTASLGFADDEKLIDIARDLRFRLADHGIQPEELRYSGHGFANLLYLSTIAVELEKACDADLTLFLVEEPEAHLHPQLQAAVLSFLEAQAVKSLRQKPDYDGPEGNVQVIVATHSPNLSAWVKSSRLICFKSPFPDGAANGAIPNETSGSQTFDVAPLNKAGLASSTAPVRRVTRCIPVAELALTPPERRKVDRYLDVTRSAMLFGGRVLLVEGIAEALLIPVFAKKVLNGNTEGLRLFRSTVFVPIEGVDFEPYVKLLLTPFKNTCIADRVVVITDGDTRTACEERSPGMHRKEKLESTAAALGSNQLLTVIASTYSLEAELLRCGNQEAMRAVFIDLHPNSLDKWEQVSSLAGDEQSQAVTELFRSVRKGDFAQRFAEHVSTDEKFDVPSYITRAIEALVE